MATYYVKHTCGHEVKHILTAREERTGKLEWLESTVCPECYKAQKQAEREQKHQQAIAETADLPALEGTEKQIRWATDIRAALRKQYQELTSKYGPAPESVAQYVEKAFLETKAKYFIENWAGATESKIFLEKHLCNLEGELGDEAFEWLNP